MLFRGYRGDHVGCCSGALGRAGKRLRELGDSVLLASGDCVLASNLGSSLLRRRLFIASQAVCSLELFSRRFRTTRRRSSLVASRLAFRRSRSSFNDRLRREYVSLKVCRVLLDGGGKLKVELSDKGGGCGGGEGIRRGQGPVVVGVRPGLWTCSGLPE